MRDATALGVGLNHSLKFSPMPPPYSSSVKTSPRTCLAIFTGRSMRKSLRLEINPRESGFCEPPSLGADLPSGKTTLGGGVPGSLHFGAIVLNDVFASRSRKNVSRSTIPPRREWMPGGRWADNSAKSIITLGRYHEEDRFQTEYWGLVVWCSPLASVRAPRKVPA